MSCKCLFENVCVMINILQLYLMYIRYLDTFSILGMAYNHKADLWSFGCVIFEICTLEKAFTGASPVILISNILSSNLNSTWRWINRPEVHHKLLEVLTRYHLLDVDPSKRRSAKEMEVFFAHCLRVNNGNGEEITDVNTSGWRG